MVVKHLCFLLKKKKYIRELIIRTNSNNDKLVLLCLKTKITKNELATMIASSDVTFSSKQELHREDLANFLYELRYHFFTISNKNFILNYKNRTFQKSVFL